MRAPMHGVHERNTAGVLTTLAHVAQYHAVAWETSDA